MRVLVVHNKYSSRVPSGENVAVEEEVRWSREAGIDVHLHTSSNDDVVAGGAARKARQAAEAVWSLSARRSLSDVIERVQPDLVHVHNLFPMFSTSVPQLAVRRGLPVVWTVHNYRITCVGGTNSRDGKECHDCSRHWRVPGIRHACYSNSTVASAVVTGASSLFAGFARRRVTPIAVSEAGRGWLADVARFDPQRVRVKYNGIPAPASLPAADPATKRTFLFAGRLSEYKGVRLLLEAWQRADLPEGAELRIIGSGDLDDVVRRAAGDDPRIRWLGQVPSAEMSAHFADARAVVVPSIWHEMFGRVAAEAMAHGRPVITTGLGGLSEVVGEETGWITGTDVSALSKALMLAAQSDDDVRHRSAAATERHRRLFSPEATTQALTAIYAEAIARPKW